MNPVPVTIWECPICKTRFDRAEHAAICAALPIAPPKFQPGDTVYVPLRYPGIHYFAEVKVVSVVGISGLEFHSLDLEALRDGRDEEVAVLPPESHLHLYELSSVVEVYDQGYAGTAKSWSDGGDKYFPIKEDFLFRFGDSVELLRYAETVPINSHTITRNPDDFRR